MKNANILLLFLGTCCFSGPLTLPEDVDEIVIEVVFRHHVSHLKPLILKLDKKKNNQFMRDLNSSTLWTDKEGIVLYERMLLKSCAMIHRIKIYKQKKIIAEFYTLGFLHYDEKSKLFYHSKELFREEYWGKHKYEAYLRQENFCDRI